MSAFGNVAKKTINVVRTPVTLISSTGASAVVTTAAMVVATASGNPIMVGVQAAGAWGLGIAAGQKTTDALDKAFDDIEVAFNQIFADKEA